MCYVPHLLRKYAKYLVQLDASERADLALFEYVDTFGNESVTSSVPL